MLKKRFGEPSEGSDRMKKRFGESSEGSDGMKKRFGTWPNHSRRKKENIMAKQIDIMGFSDLNKGLHCDFHHQACGFMTAAGAQALHIEALLPAYEELVTMESGIVNRQTAYVSTASLKTLDKERDRILGVTMQIINAHLTTIIAQKLASAQWLDAVVAPYRNIRGHDYRTETREVAGLLAALTSEAATAHIALLGLTEEVALLAEKNSAFEAALDEKLQEEAERLPQKDIDTGELRKQVDEKYAEIIRTVNAYAIVQPTEAISSFIDRMNALISLTKPGSGSSAGGSDQTGGSGSTDSGETPDSGGSSDSGGTVPGPGDDDDDSGGLEG